MVKISIELEVADHELPLATELIRALRCASDLPRLAARRSPPFSTLTDQVLIRTGAPASGGAVSAPPRASAPAAAAAPSAESIQTALCNGLGRLSVASTSGQSDVHALAKAFAEEAMGQLRGKDGASAASALVSAVAQILNSPEIGKRMDENTASVAPFVRPLATHLPEQVRKEYTSQLCKRVLEDLSTPRPAGTPRPSVFALADAFAHLVELGELKIGPAVLCICRLLRKPEKRLAGVTMLGKTVEVCFSSLADCSDVSTTNSLKEELLQLYRNEKEYDYDAQYVFECLGPALGWGALPAQGAPAPTPPPASNGNGNAHAAAPTSARQLRPLYSHSCRPGTIYALAPDSVRSQVVVAVNQPGVPDIAQVWNAGGFVGEFGLGNNMVTVLDSCPGVLLAASMARRPENEVRGSQPEPSAVRVYMAHDQSPGGWRESGVLYRPESRVLVAMRWIGTSPYSFALGEMAAGKHAVSLFEIREDSVFGNLKPVQQFFGHTDIITSVEHYAGMPSCLLSASKDGTVRVWDTKMPGRQGVYIGATPPAPSAPLLAHANMVTGMTSRGFMVGSAGADGTVTLWDLRKVACGPNNTTPPVSQWRSNTLPDGQPDPILKVAMGGAGQDAHSTPLTICTASGALYMCQPGASALSQVTPARGGRVHVLAWDRRSDVLYAGRSSDPAANGSAIVDAWGLS